jgi:hypothetical protein
MTLLLLTIVGLFLSFLIGYAMPRKAGWAVLLLLPILSPTSFTIIPANFIPLTFTRVAITITIGIMASGYGEVKLILLLRSTFVKILIFFSIILVISSSRDMYIYHQIISFLPNTFMAVTICYLIIQDTNDLKKLVVIYAWQAAFIGLFIIIEYYTDFSIAIALGSTNPNFSSEVATKASASMYRSGFYRVSGLDGNAVMTGYRLAFYFPLVLWYATWKRLNIINLIPLLAICVGFIMLQTRAAFIAIVIATVYLFFELIYRQSISLSKRVGNIFKIVIMLSLAAIIIAAISPAIKAIITTFILDSLNSSYAVAGYTLQAKISRLPIAWHHFLQHPIIGYGSPQNAYFNVMRTDDIPAPMIYLLAGGFPLGMAYLAHLLYMPYSIFKYSKTMSIDDNMKILLLVASSSFVAGIVVLFSNFQEAHIMIMTMLYIAFYKIIYLKPRLIQK